MTEAEKIYLASKAFDKGWDYETLSYGDDLYRYDGEEKAEILNDVWDYVIQIQDEGKTAFKKIHEGTRLYF